MTPAQLYLPRVKLWIAAFLFLASQAFSKQTSPHVEWLPNVIELPSEATCFALKRNPSVIAPAFIESLKKASGITDAHAVTLDGEAAEPGATAFANPANNASIAIYPGSGLFVYSDPTAEGDPTRPPVGVPSETEARALSDNLLAALELPADGFSLKAPGGERRVLYNKQSQQRMGKPPLIATPTEEVYVRGVQYFQSFGGCDLLATERLRGVHIQFGTEGRISLLEVNWVCADPDGSVAVASRPEVNMRIIKGKGRWKKFSPSNPKRYQVTSARIAYLEPAKLKGKLMPSIVVTVNIETEIETIPNEFICSAATE